ncbi:MAG: hypothetical protein LUI08_01050 [Prevotella sp.]|nr:hypothetical protein [Prevotella sp.]
MNDFSIVKPSFRNVWVNLPLTLSAIAFFTVSAISYIPSFRVIPAPNECAIILFIPAILASAFVKNAYKIIARKTTLYSAIVSAIISTVLLFSFRLQYSEIVKEQLHSLFGGFYPALFNPLCVLLWLLSAFFCTFLINWMLVRSDEEQEDLCARILHSNALRITVKCCVLVSICLFLLFMFDNYIWCDECFTLKLIALNYTDVVDITAHDVHPPLYYILLKLWVDTLSFGAKNIELTILLSRLFSLLAYALTAILCYVKLSKSRIAPWRWMLLLCFFAMQGILYYGLEIRMYSWALFFITSTYLFTMDIMTGKGGEIGRRG